MKENYPVETAEHVKASHLDDEPAFQWWVPYTLRKRDAILSVVKARTRHMDIKYGIKVLRTIKEDKAFGLQLVIPCGKTQSIWKWTQ